MEKKDYIFNAFDSFGNKIELRHANIFYSMSEEEAAAVRVGIMVGLTQKYKYPTVTCRSI